MTTLRLGLALLAALLAGACDRTAATHFYTLAPTQSSPSVAPGARQLTVGVGPVAVAEYLKRPQVVTRSSDTQLRLADFDQWVEPFDILLPRVLAQDLAAILGTNRISLMPAPRDVRLDNVVEVDVIRFDAKVGESVTLDALWRVYGKDGDRLLQQGRATVSHPVPTDASGEIDYPAVVRAMSDATGELADRIAKAIEKRGPQA